LKKALVYACEKRITERTYKRILREIAEGRKEKACVEATQLIAAQANIEQTVISDVVASLNEIRNRRGAVPWRERSLDQ